jgi:hypothetical protein
MRRATKTVAAVAAAALALAACGGDDDTLDEVGDAAADAADQAGEAAEDAADAAGDAAEDLGDAVGDAVDGDGGGTLVIDGAEIEIAAVTCVLDDDTFDVGTVSDDGTRVFVSRSNPANDVSAQILDADGVQWFPQDVQGDEAVRDGSSFSGGPYTWFNNQDDDTIEAGFQIDCP